MRKNWYAIHHRNRAFKAQRVQILEKELVEETISDEGKLEFVQMLELAERVYNKCGKGLPERTYHDYMVVLLKEKYNSVIQEQRQPYIIDGKPCGSVIPDILASNDNGDYIIEIKISNVNKGFLQLGQYLLNTKNRTGFLVCYGISGVELYMLLSVSDSDCVCFDGDKLYAMNLNAHRT